MPGKRRRRGYLIEELLICLLICSFLIPITVVSIQILVGSLHYPVSIQDEISLLQIRHVIMVSDDFSTNGKSLYFHYHDDDNSSLVLTNRKIILKPGTNILLTEIDDVSFCITDVITMTYRRNDKTEQRIIGHV